MSAMQFLQKVATVHLSVAMDFCRSITDKTHVASVAMTRFIDKTNTNIKNGLSECCIQTFNASSHVYEKLQDIRKTNPTYSMAMNIAHNTTPYFLGLGSKLVVDTALPGLSYATPLIPFVAQACYTGKNYLYKDEAKALDAFIKYFDKLTTETQFSNVNPHAFELNLKHPISYKGCIAAIDSLVNIDSRKLFNWHSITGEDRAPFESLREALNKSPTIVSSDIKNAAQDVIAKLIELKATRAGILTETYKYPDLHPRFKELSLALSILQNELKANSPTEGTITKIKELIELTSDAPSIFVQIIPNKEPKAPSNDFMSDLANFKRLLETFQKIPNSLKNCPFLKGNQEQLQNDLNKLLRDCPKTLAPLQPNKAQETSPLIQLSEALTFYPNYKTAENKSTLQDSLEQALNTIDAIYDKNFKNSFLLEVGKNHLPVQIPAPQAITAPASKQKKGKKGQAKSTPVIQAPPQPNPIIDDQAYISWSKENLLSATIEDFDNTLKSLAQNAGIDPNQSREALIQNLFKN
ncbi:MAG: hypothetical protein WCG10_00595 [Chlamydiota bacterium]